MEMKTMIIEDEWCDGQNAHIFPQGTTNRIYSRIIYTLYRTLKCSRL